ncbi:hypothetical protein HBI56_190480 [Parastagonospora nodorum]|uniref:Uncharacterized protein n=1 Tax=Phaeosphaeria nodorum (strain SN15 / ATCC MYA-4574 / FGSC 10173) TaxID=321614 RepID=A0A7U2I4J9_PHANO|nr:hypothetical protein HBH56_143970 [Parastagonospora nodorum]QRD01444.1 hypothetical protein JI435_416680 [Parastagonospora nodorum SN15]KAH3927830.1 hypothetical protein HBH54_149160 [Parastagonospora nodorum]KAH3961969.1 hypothetical protein HBH51_177810 [Parastagonospora nodorum]KAH3970955.1 hypothetical protein HBH52_162340 [Parastagonospora nodorum]
MLHWVKAGSYQASTLVCLGLRRRTQATKLWMVPKTPVLKAKRSALDSKGP